jgi:predicted nucleic acid-binding protein
MLDDEPARRLARQLGLPVIGTVGILLAAKRRALVASVRPILDALIDVDFRLSPELYASALNEAGENT